MIQKLFPTFGLCLITLLAFPHAHYADSWWAQAVSHDQEILPEPALVRGTKDPGLAVGLAAFPGIVIHGSGHMYAGRPLTAAMLFLVEAGAVYMTYRGVTDVITFADEHFIDDSTDVEVIEGLEDTGQLSRALGLAVGGVVLFLSSWLYDLTGAPIAADEVNAKLKKNTGPTVKAKLKSTGFELEFGQLF